jgi:hypothetical protein
MSDIKVRKLPEGGWGIFTLDRKTKAEQQTGYIGPNLKVEAFLPEGAELEK